jgi:hypothetical protein
MREGVKRVALGSGQGAEQAASHARHTPTRAADMCTHSLCSEANGVTAEPMVPLIWFWKRPLCAWVARKSSHTSVGTNNHQMEPSKCR